MKIAIKLAFATAIFCLGLLIGYRATITHLELNPVSPCRIEVTAWGQTDLYVLAES